MVKGVDEAWQRLPPDVCAAYGIEFVIGYVSADTTGKRITLQEINAYLNVGVGVGLVYEDSAGAFLGGATIGASHAARAVTQAQALGYPTGCAIATAIDKDTSADPGTIDAYLWAFTRGCHTAGYRSMVYGGLSTIRRAGDLGLVDLLWQTYAWSNGVWDPRAAIRQIQNGVLIAGRDVDIDVAMVSDYGFWQRGFTVTDSSNIKSIFDAVFVGGSSMGGSPVPVGDRTVMDGSGTSIASRLAYLTRVIEGVTMGGGLTDADRALITALTDAVNSLNSRLASP
jgi:hypothetical protein